MKYYTNLEGFNANSLLKYNGMYGLPHASFYLSLLPKEYKDKLMFVANDETTYTSASSIELQNSS